MPCCIAKSSWLGHVESGKETDWAKCSQDDAHNGKSREKKLETFSKPDSTAEGQAEHPIEHSINK